MPICSAAAWYLLSRLKSQCCQPLVCKNDGRVAIRYRCLPLAKDICDALQEGSTVDVVLPSRIAPTALDPDDGLLVGHRPAQVGKKMIIDIAAVVGVSENTSHLRLTSHYVVCFPACRAGIELEASMTR